MRKLFLISILIQLIVCPTVWAEYSNKIMPLLKSRMSQTGADSTHKVWIYFADKDTSSDNFQKAADAISERAQNRRANIPLDEYDLPITQSYLDSIANTGAKNIHQSKWLNAVSAYMNSSAIEYLSKFDFIRKIDIVKTLRRDLPREQKVIEQAMMTDSADYGLSYNQNHMLGVDSAHALGLDGQGVLIALIDSGFRFGHPALDSIIVIDSYDFINNDTSVDDDLPTAGQINHGTKVLSVMGGYMPGSLIGPAPSAQYMLYKTEIVDIEITLEEDLWVMAAERASDMGADIISTSLGYAYFDDTTYTYDAFDGNTTVTTIAADIAASRGILVVVSAGNEGNKPWHYIIAPADGDSVIAVGAVDPDLSPSDFTSFGPTYDGRVKPELAAQGTMVVGASTIGTGITFLSGTSFAAPQIAGIAALVIQANPHLKGDPDQIRQRLIESGNNYPSFDLSYRLGYGIPNVLKAAKNLRIRALPIVYLSVGQDTAIDIRVDKLEGMTVTLEIENLPPDFDLIDNGDGTATLYAIGLSTRVGAYSYTIVAREQNGLIDSLYFTIITVRAGSPFVVGPNPFTDYLVINSAVNFEQGYVIQIFSLNGEMILEQNIHENQYVWRGQNQQNQNIASGVYFIRITADGIEERVKVFKF
ncbi:MAG: S8 family serine peptidase [candidate division Zixibacteria bacterium]